MPGKKKFWMSWWWNSDLYYCKIPTKETFDKLKRRMETFTAADTDAYFNEMTLMESEPQIGEYIARKRLEVFLDNIDAINTYRNKDEHTAIESMEDILKNLNEFD